METEDEADEQPVHQAEDDVETEEEGQVRNRQAKKKKKRRRRDADEIRKVRSPILVAVAPEKLGHQFALSPVPDALAWLDAMTGLDPEESIRFLRISMYESLTYLSHNGRLHNRLTSNRKCIQAIH